MYYRKKGRILKTRSDGSYLVVYEDGRTQIEKADNIERIIDLDDCIKEISDKPKCRWCKNTGEIWGLNKRMPCSECDQDKQIIEDSTNSIAGSDISGQATCWNDEEGDWTNIQGFYT